MKRHPAGVVRIPAYRRGRKRSFVGTLSVAFGAGFVNMRVGGSKAALRAKADGCHARKGRPKRLALPKFRLIVPPFPVWPERRRRSSGRREEHYE